MTCKEYRHQVSGCNPHEQTSSTIVAVVSHDIECKKCRKWRKARMAKIESQMTDGEKLLSVMQATVVSSRVVNDLETDPELP